MGDQFRVYEVAYTFPGGYGGSMGHYDIKVEARSPEEAMARIQRAAAFGRCDSEFIASLPVPEDEDAADPAPEEIAAVSRSKWGRAAGKDGE